MATNIRYGACVLVLLTAVVPKLSWAMNCRDALRILTHSQNEGRTFQLKLKDGRVLQIRSPRLESVTYEATAGLQAGQTEQMLGFDIVKDGKYENSTLIPTAQIEPDSLRILPKILSKREQQFQSIFGLNPDQQVEFLDSSGKKQTVQITSAKPTALIHFNIIEDGKYSGSGTIEAPDVNWDSVRIVPATLTPTQQMLRDIVSLPPGYTVEFLDRDGNQHIVRVRSKVPSAILEVDNIKDGQYSGSSSIETHNIQWNTIAIIPSPDSI